MGYIIQHNENAVDIYATKLDGETVLIHSDDKFLAEHMAGYNPIRTILITEFTDKHPSGARSSVSLGIYGLPDTHLLNPFLPTPYVGTELLQESAQDIQNLFKEAKITLPGAHKRPSQGALARFFDVIAYKTQPFTHFITHAPIPRV